MLFKDLGLSPEVLAGIQDIGFDTPTEIQQKAIPIALDKKNLLATSATGSGKTAAFAIPILNNIYLSKKTGIQALILAPTRELAKQTDEQFWSLGYHTGITSVTVYGGGDWSEQERALKGGVNIVVATPGRLMDHMKIFNYDFSNIEFLVLDEADRMLDMGFLPDVRSILNRMPKNRQNYLFSATMNKDIEKLASEITGGKYERIKIGIPAPAKGINQVSYHVEDENKLDLLVHLYETQKWHSAIVFSSTKRGVDQLSRALKRKGAPVESIHGDRDQKEREETLERFKKGKVNVLVATDVMARGIDVDNISHVINYDVPNDLDDYIHRIGRTARAESTGDAITFVTRRTFRSMKVIYDALSGSINKLPVPDQVLNPGSKQRQSNKNQNKGRTKSTNNSTEEKRADSTSQKSDNDSKAGEKPNKPKRRPGRKPKRNTRSKQADDANKKEKSKGAKAEKAEKAEKSQKKPKRQPRRKPARDKNNSVKDDSGNRSNAQNKRSKKPTQNKRKSQKDTSVSPEEKRLKKQEALIKQVQESSMPKRKTKNNKSSEDSGIWSKIKGIFK